MLLAPGGGRFTELVEGATPGCQHACEAVQRADRCQDGGGIRPLGAPSLDPASGFPGDQEGIQQALGGIMRQQPVATLGPEGASEAWVGPLKAEGVFPRQAAADGIRRRTLGAPFDSPA